LEHKIGIDFTVSSTLKQPSKNYTCFILRRFRLFSTLGHPAEIGDFR